MTYGTIDLRSDTVTKPTPAMRQAMAEAEVGDDVYGEDPTVNRLQQEAAELLGKESAIFVCSGTMGNLSSVLAHCSERGSEAILGDQSHIYQYEAGGVSVLGGVAFNLLKNTAEGLLSIADIAAAIRPEDQHAAATRCICIETTHNRCGGTVLPLDYLDQLHELAQSQRIAVHLDGARIFNAATALGVPVSRIASCVDSVQFCLSKGLAAPAGSIVAGTRDFIKKVHKLRKMLGGGQRQTGVLAAPGRIALLEMSKRLQEDHDNAALLARGIMKLSQAEMRDAPQSNIVIFQVKPPHTPSAVIAALKSKGVLAIAFMGGVRMVTHHGITQQDCQQALDVLTEVLHSDTAPHAIGRANGAAANGYAH